MKKFVASVIFLLTLVSLLGACSMGKKEQEIVIGMPMPKAGSGAYIGMPTCLFAEDYFEKINEAGGLFGSKFKVISYDISADTAVEAVNMTNRLISQDKAFAIIGSTGSAASIPMADIVTNAKVPMVVPTATNEKVTVKEDGTLNPYTFRVCFIDNYQGQAAANYAYVNLGYRRVGMFDEVGEPYSQGICDYFEEEFVRLGGTITTRITVPQNEVEFRPQLTAMAETGIDAIFCPADSYVRASRMINQAKDLGIDAPFIMADANYDNALLEECGANANGILLTNGLYAEDPQFKSFQDEFKQKYPEWEANMYVLYTYDCAELLVWAIKEAGSFDKEKVRDALENAKNVKLFTDPDFNMDPATHNPLNKTVAIIGVENEQFTLIDTFRPQ